MTTEISSIGPLLKKIYRLYSKELHSQLEKRGYKDLTPGIIEVLAFVNENEGASIKFIGDSLGLKKQTMTSHINELTNRGYIQKKTSPTDRRAQCIYLSDLGLKFQIAFYEITSEIEIGYQDLMGAIELKRLNISLEKFFTKIESKDRLF